MLIKNNKAAGLFSCHEDSNLSQKLVQLVNNEFIRNQGTHCEDTPVVTVIITTHKRPPKLVSRAVLSVCNQTYKNLEIIIVDDSPSDYAERMDVYESIKRIEDPRITYLFNEENVGACASRNRAIENSSGEFVMYVDDDDELLAECVEKRLEKFTAPEIGLVYGDCYTVNEVTGEKKQSNQDKYAGKVFDELIKTFPIYRTIGLT